MAKPWESRYQTSKSEEEVVKDTSTAKPWERKYVADTTDEPESQGPLQYAGNYIKDTAKAGLDVLGEGVTNVKGSPDTLAGISSSPVAMLASGVVGLADDVGRAEVESTDTGRDARRDNCISSLMRRRREGHCRSSSECQPSMARQRGR